MLILSCTKHRRNPQLDSTTLPYYNFSEQRLWNAVSFRCCRQSQNHLTKLSVAAPRESSLSARYTERSSGTSFLADSNVAESMLKMLVMAGFHFLKVSLCWISLCSAWFSARAVHQASKAQPVQRDFPRSNLE